MALKVIFANPDTGLVECSVAAGVLAGGIEVVAARSLARTKRDGRSVSRSDSTGIGIRIRIGISIGIGNSIGIGIDRSM